VSSACIRSLHPSRATAAGGRLRRRPELAVYALLLLLLNTGGTWLERAWDFGFRPDAVATVEAWRILTHPFVHLSYYHLLLDATAFLGLAAMLESRSAWRRLLTTALCAGGALLGAWLTGQADDGYAGLSGAAHGLFAMVCIELYRSGTPEALWGLLLLLAKCLLEMLLGGNILQMFHLGFVGTPVPACHAGGALAGVLAAAVKLGPPPLGGRAYSCSTTDGH
jgi:rhomboid family GlyGly-CTERM serine protease